MGHLSCNLLRVGGSVAGKRKCEMSIAIGIGIGALAGFANYKFIGCATGTCPLSSNPWIATIYGMLLGGLIGSALRAGH